MEDMEKEANVETDKRDSDLSDDPVLNEIM